MTFASKSHALAHLGDIAAKIFTRITIKPIGIKILNTTRNP